MEITPQKTAFLQVISNRVQEGESRTWFGARRRGGRDRRAGISMDVDFVGTGCGVPLSKIIRKRKASFENFLYISDTFIKL